MRMSEDESQYKLEELIKIMEDKKRLEYENSLTGNDLLKQNLMKHVNGIVQQTDDDVVINHCIDLKLLIDTIIKKVG